MSTRKTGENTSETIARLTRKVKLLEEKLEAQKRELHARMDGQEVWIRNCPPQNSNLFKMMCSFRKLEEEFIEQKKLIDFLLRKFLPMIEKLMRK